MTLIMTLSPQAFKELKKFKFSILILILKGKQKDLVRAV